MLKSGLMIMGYFKDKLNLKIMNVLPHSDVEKMSVIVILLRIKV